MKIAIVGNCQGQALERLIRSGDEDHKLYGLSANYQVSESDRDQFDLAYADCDAILIQNVSEMFPTDFVRPDYARSFGKPVIVWPVVYFDGYFPDIGYLRLGDRAPLMGPIGGYHSHFIRTQFLAGRSEAETCIAYTGEEYAEQYQGTFDRSIATLAEREQPCDIRTAPAMAEAVRDRFCFATPNHPAGAILATVLRQAETLLGTDFGEIDPAAARLDDIYIPVNRDLLRREGGRFQAASAFVAKMPDGGFRGISVQDIVAGFYQTYAEVPIEVLRQGIAC